MVSASAAFRPDADEPTPTTSSLGGSCLRFKRFAYNCRYRRRQNCMEVATCTPLCARCHNHTHAFVQVVTTMHRPAPASGHHASGLTRNDLPASFGGGSGLE